MLLNMRVQDVNVDLNHSDMLDMIFILNMKIISTIMPYLEKVYIPKDMWNSHSKFKSFCTWQDI
jgi:hypothetical protein